MEKLEWSALEYEEKERGADWFWALGVIVFASGATAVIYSNYFFATLIVLSGILLGFFAKKKPEEVLYELNNRGLKIKNRLYPYENIKSFWVQKKEQSMDLPEVKSILFIKSERLVMPTIAIPIEDNLAEEIHSIMISKNVVEETMKEHPSEKIMEFLGF
ncbi:hypothetical protein A3C60_01040 [Candidatus Nomurabacteria bacterium RIFCSPHIGHO2_02_FULL_37_45]|uniref:DUF5673 domain-containing protein n=2 Tax=Candidatus Nomuraibacteriota TaxID=1752729 RepID=A0A1F6Y582_9BACT|nr:MAG: hypothetical protein A2727_02295 [Candidatus Nomurabacteria bacterium RIFCSPHIGHO2_01_FULL_37_110]OGI71039.1 MAG: hypothetical protein A3C60_01040 [Candidatus Nomurabacteria bacterium RIFCSPHIGHO2_02_FULL_37_45]OGI79122.1 MAG: hypothetical protein A3F19_00475 [Candidatus Nomurabacteria bacterium RIFCSPHIGHO2_12_FULL_37_29]OGI84376.1 MAG: hypothetical protein A3A92_01015 [Candidatus Nomurabacteria bacterium RIFCSPLOWO2_01_FULL_37_49]OGJ01514.1 MAG: hypothetical protein A3G98_00240 [Candi